MLGDRVVSWPSFCKVRSLRRGDAIVRLGPGECRRLKMGIPSAKESEVRRMTDDRFLHAAAAITAAIAGRSQLQPTDAAATYFHCLDALKQADKKREAG